MGAVEALKRLLAGRATIEVQPDGDVVVSWLSDGDRHWNAIRFDGAEVARNAEEVDAARPGPDEGGE